MTSEMFRTPSEQEVLHAADEIIEAFTATDTVRYFAGFAIHATFVFHPEPKRLNSRKEYETLWTSWLADHWRVVSCQSSDRWVQVFPGGAVFSHTVHTETATGDVLERYRERETIVFQVTDEGLIGIHEHLSPFDEHAAA